MSQALPARARLSLRSPGRLAAGLVELVFGPDDEDRFQRWLGVRGRPVELRVDAEFVFEFKWGYLDGHLGRWRTADLDEQGLLAPGPDASRSHRTDPPHNGFGETAIRNARRQAAGRQQQCRGSADAGAVMIAKRENRPQRAGSRWCAA